MVANRTKYHVCVTILWTPAVKGLKTTVCKSPYLFCIWKKWNIFKKSNPCAYHQPMSQCRLASDSDNVEYRIYNLFPDIPWNVKVCLEKNCSCRFLKQISFQILLAFLSKKVTYQFHKPCLTYLHHQRIHCQSLLDCMV